MDQAKKDEVTKLFRTYQETIASVAVTVTERLRTAADLLEGGRDLNGTEKKAKLIEIALARIDSVRAELAGALAYLVEKEARDEREAKTRQYLDDDGGEDFARGT